MWVFIPRGITCIVLVGRTYAYITPPLIPRYPMSPQTQMLLEEGARTYWSYPLVINK